VNLVALRIPSAMCSAAMQKLQGSLLDLPRLRSIVEDPKATNGTVQATSASPSTAAPSSNQQTRLILLNQSLTEASMDSCLISKR
jgi:hypothetical protein